MGRSWWSGWSRLSWRVSLGPAVLLPPGAGSLGGAPVRRRLVTGRGCGGLEPAGSDELSPSVRPGNGHARPGAGAVWTAAPALYCDDEGPGLEVHLVNALSMSAVGTNPCAHRGVPQVPAVSVGGPPVLLGHPCRPSGFPVLCRSGDGRVLRYGEAVCRGCAWCLWSFLDELAEVLDVYPDHGVVLCNVDEDVGGELDGVVDCALVVQLYVQRVCLVVPVDGGHWSAPFWRGLPAGVNGCSARVGWST